MRLLKPLQFLAESRLFLCVVLASISVSCAAVEPAPETFAESTVDNISATDETWSEHAREVLMNALSLTGVKYKFGGNSPETGFDCSGFVRYVFKQATSLTLPHSALAISQLGKSIPKSELAPGDLVFFKTVKNVISHVGIYMGNNRFIHSPSAGGNVRVESMQEGYWATRYIGAQRLEKSEENTAPSE